MVRSRRSTKWSTLNGAQPTETGDTGEARYASVEFKSSTEKHGVVAALKAYTDTQQIPDPYKGAWNASVGASQSIMDPPFNMWTFAGLPDQNDILKTCITAMVTNVTGHGYSLVYVGPKGKETSDAAVRERAIIEGLCDYPNPYYGSKTLWERFWYDFECSGNGFLEIGRAPDGVRIDSISHLPSYTMRLTSRDMTTTEAEMTLPRSGKGTGKQKVHMRFRRFVQAVNGKQVWFKEFARCAGRARSLDFHHGPGRALTP